MFGSLNSLTAPSAVWKPQQYYAFGIKFYPHKSGQLVNSGFIFFSLYLPRIHIMEAWNMEHGANKQKKCAFLHLFETMINVRHFVRAFDIYWKEKNGNKINGKSENGSEWKHPPVVAIKTFDIVHVVDTLNFSIAHKHTHMLISDAQRDSWAHIATAAAVGLHDFACLCLPLPGSAPGKAFECTWIILSHNWKCSINASDISTAIHPVY